jgi:transmembrane sensor
MMKNIVEFPDRKVIEEEAGAWLIKLDGDNAPTVEELASLREWLGRSPVHREQLGRLADFWGKMNVLTELAVPLGHPERRANRGLIQNVRHANPKAGLASLAAAIVVIGIGVATSLWYRPDPFLSSNGLYATAIGQQQSTMLADGSVVLLNTNSQLKVDYNSEFRDTRLLQGEAHFTVEKDATRPFRVYAGNKRVQAVGTAFSVYLKENTVDVTVTEGEVALVGVGGLISNSILPQETRHAASQAFGTAGIVDSQFAESLGTIKAGESASIPSIFDAGSVHTIDAVETIEESEMAKRLSWRDGILTFAGDPLVVVVEEISRYTTISIEITDPVVRATRIGGRFPIGETDAMFDALEANFGLRVTRLSQDRVLVSAASE